METSAGQSKTKIIASTNVFQIEKIEKIGKADYPKLIEISLHLAKEYGKQAVFTKASIEKYFNTEKSLPFIARYQNEIIGYIIGIPLEELNMEPWALNDGGQLIFVGKEITSKMPPISDTKNIIKKKIYCITV